MELEYTEEWYEETIDKLKQLVENLEEIYKERKREQEEIIKYENDIKEREISLIESERKWDEETDNLILIIEENSRLLNKIKSQIKKNIEERRHEEEFGNFYEYEESGFIPTEFL